MQTFKILFHKTFLTINPKSLFKQKNVFVLLYLRLRAQSYRMKIYITDEIFDIYSMPYQLPSLIASRKSKQIKSIYINTEMSNLAKADFLQERSKMKRVLSFYPLTKYTVHIAY